VVPAAVLLEPEAQVWTGSEAGSAVGPLAVFTEAERAALEYTEAMTMSELEYTGITETLSALDSRFRIRSEAAARAAA